MRCALHKITSIARVLGMSGKRCDVDHTRVYKAVNMLYLLDVLREFSRDKYRYWQCVGRGFLQRVIKV